MASVTCRCSRPAFFANICLIEKLGDTESPQDSSEELRPGKFLAVVIRETGFGERDARFFDQCFDRLEARQCRVEQTLAAVVGSSDVPIHQGDALGSRDLGDSLTFREIGQRRCTPFDKLFSLFQAPIPCEAPVHEAVSRGVVHDCLPLKISEPLIRARSAKAKAPHLPRLACAACSLKIDGRRTHCAKTEGTYHRYLSQFMTFWKNPFFGQVFRIDIRSPRAAIHADSELVPPPVSVFF